MSLPELSDHVDIVLTHVLAGEGDIDDVLLEVAVNLDVILTFDEEKME